jgi:tetratricopeptide (TPR) repeat protein
MVGRILMALVLAAVAQARAATIKGTIILNELSGPPVPNVQIIDLAHTAGPWASGSDGGFTLEYSKRHPGERVRLVVNKQGYVVVNDVQLEIVLPADADATPLTVILAKEEDREEMARRFYRLKSFDGIEESYQKTLKEVEDAQQASVSAFAKLRQERDQARTILEKAVAEWAKMQPGQTSELYQQAERLFLDGKIEEAIKVLDDEKLRHPVTPANRSVEDAVRAWSLKAQLLIVQFRFDEAETAYLAAVDTAPDNFSGNFAFASFTNDLKRYDKAMAAYARCVELAKKGGNNPELALTLNNLGNVDRNQNRKDAAQKAYKEALKTYRLLAQNDPETYLPQVAGTLNNLGELYKDQNRLRDARQAIEEAQKIRIGIAQNVGPGGANVSVIARRDATERQRRIAEKRARLADEQMNSERKARVRKTRYIAVATVREKNSKGAESVMIFDTQGQQVVGNSVYDVKSTPKEGQVTKWDTHTAEYVGTGD